MKKTSQFAYVLVYLLGLLISCTPAQQSTENNQLHIVCTTGMVSDLVENIVKDKANVTSIMGPGVDPHLYKASHGDLTLLRDADIIFYNGLHLEGKMQEVLVQLAKSKPVYAVGDALNESELLSGDNGYNTHDPHIWFDVSLWSKTVGKVSKNIAELDKENAKSYRENQLEFETKLTVLHSWAQKQLQTIPDQNKVLITSHDAFGYFGKAYGIQVKGLQGISTTTEFGLKDVNEMVNMIIENKIKAVFIESTISERSLNAVLEGCKSKGHDVKIGGTLYSDAMGNKGTDEGTYIGMVKHNVNTIVKALK